MNSCGSGVSALACASGLSFLYSILDRIAALCATGRKDQTACKPGSVRPCEGRDLAAIPLGCLLPGTSRDTPGAQAGYSPCAPPIRSCSGRGLPCRSCRQSRGELLPHPFTLTPPRRGGLLSVALSLGLRRAAVSRRPVSLEPGLSSSMPLPACQRLPGRLVWRVYRGKGRPWPAAITLSRRSAARTFRAAGRSARLP